MRSRFTPIIPMLILGVLLFLGATSAPIEAQPATTSHQQYKIEQSCTSTSATVSFAFTPGIIWFKNDLNSANEVYYLLGLGSAVTTTTGIRLEPGDGVAISGTAAQWLGLRCITAATETATVYGQAIR